MAHLIKTNGEIIEISPINGTDFSLEELQKYVGGHIEVINLHNEAGDQIMVLHDEGKLTSNNYNELATSLARLYQAIFDNDYIAGDVVVCKSEEVV